MDEPVEKPPIENRVGAAILITIGLVTLAYFGRGVLVRRAVGPGLRWVYRVFPELKQVIRVSVGDVPLIHAEEATGHVLFESAFTMGFWGAYMTDSTVQEVVHELTHSLFEALFSGEIGGVPLISYLPDLAPRIGAARLPGVVRYDYDGGTALSSPAGRVAMGTVNSWEVDP